MKETFLEHEFDSFSDVQKLEFILFFAIPQKDVNPIAHRLLNEFGSLSKVFAASYEDLIKVEGVGSHTAIMLKTYKAISLAKTSLTSVKNLSSVSATMQYCNNLLKDATVEEFYVICLDEQNKVIKHKRMNTGRMSSVHIEIHDIMKFIYSQQATSIIIAHNHPSGNAIFSDEDLMLTHNIMASCLLSEVRLIDHILVAGNTQISMARQGTIAKIQDAVVKRFVISDNMLNKIKSPTIPYIID